MTQPLLSILIPTVVGREDEFERLFYSLVLQLPDEICNLVEICWEKDNKEISIGEKRNKLYQKARGLYSMQCDDDDKLAKNFVSLVLEAIKQNSDCITFQEHCNMNGVEYGSNHSLIYDDWEGDGSKLLSDGWHFHRTPFMKSVIKTEIARSVPVPFCRFGEDHLWSQALKPHLKTEVHIPQYLYFYEHNSKPEEFNQRYGYDKEIIQ